MACAARQVLHSSTEIAVISIAAAQPCRVLIAIAHSEAYHLQLFVIVNLAATMLQEWPKVSASCTHTISQKVDKNNFQLSWPVFIAAVIHH